MREVLGDFSGGAEEETITHLHDGGFVDDPDLVFANICGVLEGVSQYTFGGSAGDKLDRLYDTVDDYVFDTTVFTLGVFSDQDCVYVIVGCFVSSDTLARSHVGEEIERPSQRQVEGDVTFANRCCKRSF